MDQELTEIACPKCKAPTIQRVGKFGKFFGCVNYPDCDGILNTFRGKPINPDQDCPACGEKMNLILGKYGPFFGCPNYREKGCGLLKLKDAVRWTEVADHDAIITKADRRKKRKVKNDEELNTVLERANAGEVTITIYSDRVKGARGFTSLRPTEEGEAWVGGLRKKEFKLLGIEIIETGNRYGGWYYLVYKADLEKYPFIVKVI